MVGALPFLPIFLIGLTSAQCPTPCGMTKVFKVGEMCGPPGDQFHCGGQWRLQTPNPHPRCTQTRSGRRVNVCMYRREEDNKEYCFCDPGSSIYNQNLLSGKSCDRVCTPTTQKKTCEFVFILENLFSNTFNRKVLMYNRKMPGPPITVCEGDDVVVGLINNLQDIAPSQGDDPRLPPDSTTLHFHGIREKQKSSSYVGYSEGGPWSDGVPLVTQCPIPKCPGTAITGLGSCVFTYKFLGSGPIEDVYNNAPAGTYWYHSHVGRQRLNGAAGNLIIMPKNERTDLYTIDEDHPENSLFLQEWYPTFKNEIPTMLLVNGKGKQNREIYKCDFPIPLEKCIKLYKEGGTVKFTKISNPDYPSPAQSNYEVFHVNPGKRYRFRIIGGIGDNVPIRISIEDHTFTAIATDSIDIKPEHDDLDALWITGGERYDIVITTKPHPKHGDAYKINVFHSQQTGLLDSKIVLCSLAWLKYPQQTVNSGHEANCADMESALTLTHLGHKPKVLNPVPDDNSEWIDHTYYIYPDQLRALKQTYPVGSSPNILNPQYINMPGLTFNNFHMKYPDVPFLFQSPSDTRHRCGVKCLLAGSCEEPFPAGCVAPFPPITKQLTFEHVIQQPWRNTGNDWFEIILFNPYSSDDTGVAHPIHHHGGWFNIVAMDQLDRTTDQMSEAKMKAMYPTITRNFDKPVFKDTIQVPTNGYVIFIAPIDNAGAWLVHCHINWHLEHGMAMVFQIGEPDGSNRWSMGPDQATAIANKDHKCF